MADVSSGSVPSTGESQAERLLRYPSGTAVGYALLVALTVLSGVFIGEEFVLLSYPPTEWDSAAAGISVWLAPAVLLAVTTGLTVLYPGWRERHARWTPIPAELGRIAAERVARLSAAAQVSPTPRLMWHSAAADQPPFVYGRPRHYRLWLSPQGLSAARRRPERFDNAIRHELAHLANRDVFVGRFAVLAWYVTLPALAFTPLLRVILRQEWRFLGEYAVRAIALGLLLTLVRDRLLRLREHYADVRAAAWTGSGDLLVAALSDGADPAPRAAWRRAFSRHPSPAERIEVITDPNLLGRLSSVEFLSVGLMVGAGSQVVSRLIMALSGGWASSGVPVVVADGLARALLFGLLGVHAGLTLARANAATQVGRRNLPAAAGSSVLGVVIGILASPQQLGLLRYSSQILVSGLVTALLAAGFVIVFVADTARARSARGAVSVSRQLAVVGGACAALAALAVLPITEVVAWVRLDAVVWFETISFGVFPLLLGLFALAVSLWVPIRTRQLPSILTGIGIGIGAGLLGTAVASVLKAAAGHGLSDDHLVALYYAIATVTVIAAVGACALSAMVGRAGTLVGVLGGATGTLACTIGVFVTWNLLGGYLPAASVLRLFHLVAGTAILLALPFAAAGSLTRRWHAPGP